MPYKNLDKALLFLRNQVFCLKIWKLWRAPTILQFNFFFAETSHTFSTFQRRQKSVRDFFYFIYILSYLQKLKKTWFLQNRFLQFY